MSAAPGRNRKRRLMGEINVVPYIDVMLVLLVIFMVTAPLLVQGVQVELPKQSNHPLPTNSRENQPPLTISIDREARVFSSLVSDSKVSLDDAALLANVSAALQSAPERDVLIRADTAVPYGRVLGVMTLLQQGGAKKIGFLSDPLPVQPQRRR
jgi:biopolymer transport protein TolR